MKILYVEDELSKNIPRIIVLFREYLEAEQVKALENLEHDESGYGASPEEIKKIVEATDVVDVEYRFPDALYKIISWYEQYDRFIFDRNLIESKYTIEEIQKIDPDYTEQMDKAYTEREGDYLFLKLGLCSQGKVLEKVHFLTAYSNQDELRRHQEIASLLDHWHVPIRGFIEKGDYKAIETLRDEIISLRRRHMIKEKCI